MNAARKMKLAADSLSDYEILVMETPPVPPAGTPPPPEAPLLPASPSPDERTWAVAAHLSALAGHFIPFGHIFGPLVVWLVKRDASDFVADQAKEALNAQISVTIYAAVAIGVCLTIIGMVIGVPFLLALWLADLIFIIVAAATANGGNRYRYPLILRLIK